MTANVGRRNLRFFVVIIVEVGSIHQGGCQFVKNSVFFFLLWICAANAAISGEPQAFQDMPAPRARVVIVENADATVAFEPRFEIVQKMVDQGITKLTKKPSVEAAWKSLISPRDIVGIKVYSGPGRNSGTRPAVVEAVVAGMLKTGIPASNIIVWDRRLVDLRLAGFSYLASHYHIRLAGSADAGYDPKVFYSNPLPGDLSAGDLEFDRDRATSGNKSYVTKLLTQSITKIISIAPLLNHNTAGVSGNLYNLTMGSVDNALRFRDRPEALARAVPEIYALPAVGDRVVLNITDALIGQYQGEEMSLLHFSTPLNQIWFSKDPVALDVLAVDELNREREAAKMISNGNNPQLYQNAGLMELGVPDLSRIWIDKAK
jgi:hypothetical protein